MPSFDKTGFVVVNSLVAGQPAYFFGGFNDKQAPCRFRITNVLSVGGTATITGSVVEGNAPLVNDLYSSQGCADSSFNVTAQSITAVSIDSTSGVGTIQYAMASSVATKVQSGLALIPVSETTETLANGASICLTVPYQNAITSAGRSVKVVVNIPGTKPSTAKVTLQSALSPYDSEFSDLVTVASIAASTMTGGQAVVTLEPGKFYRLNVSNVSGAAAKITAKILA